MLTDFPEPEYKKELPFVLLEEGTNDELNFITGFALSAIFNEISLSIKLSLLVEI
jgi:hypothetical protein